MKDQKKRLLRTPKYKIPIGEPIKMADGGYALRIKRPNGSDVEEISMEKMFAMVVKEAHDGA